LAAARSQREAILMPGKKRHDADARELTVRRTRDDEDLESAVRRALVDDMAVPDRMIHTSASEGTVLLEGAVTCACEREEAERAAASVPGVIAVRNEIAVWPSDVESEVVRETTREMLEARRGARLRLTTAGEANTEDQL
jgi:hypothetical protein